MKSGWLLLMTKMVTETDHLPQLVFRYWPKGNKTWDNKSDNGEIKTILGFIEICLNDLTLWRTMEYSTFLIMISNYKKENRKFTFPSFRAY